MDNHYDRGAAFIFEGDTEKHFYRRLTEFYCGKHQGSSLDEEGCNTTGEKDYVLRSNGQSCLIRSNVVGTITQVTHSGNWFNHFCAKSFPGIKWDVFLCYDTDAHDADISKFYKGDWNLLREQLKKKKTRTITDMAAAADIEDVFLQDPKGVFKYLGINDALCDLDIPSGRKGKSRLKQLFRKYGTAYHEGERAIPLIESLDMEKIVQSRILPFEQMETILFEAG